MACGLLISLPLSAMCRRGSCISCICRDIFVFTCRIHVHYLYTVNYLYTVTSVCVAPLVVEGIALVSPELSCT